MGRNDQSLIEELEWQQAVEDEMTDNEFKQLKNNIRATWKTYDDLQKIYMRQTGLRYKWLR